MAAVTAAALLAGCSPSQSRGEALSSVEINDQPVELPGTQLVICRRTANQQPRFFWTGAEVTVPRRPLEEHRFDMVDVQFDDQPLTPLAVAFRFAHHGEQITGQWPSLAGVEATVMLTSLGPRHYLLTAAMPRLGPQSASRISLRLEFIC